MQLTPAGRLFASATSFQMFWQANEQSGAFSEGFHTHTSPEIQANAVFQHQTATGKFERADDADHAEWVVLLVHPVIGAL